MANSFNNAGSDLGTGWTTVYTAPGTQKAIVHSLFLSNGSASAVAVDVAVHRPATASYLPVAQKLPVAANAAPIHLDKPVTLLAGDRLVAKGSAIGVAAFASVVENDPPGGAFAIAYKGAFAPGTAYKVLDAVTAAGFLWFCLADHTSGAAIDEAKFVRAVDGDAFTAQAEAAAAMAQAAAATGVRWATAGGGADAVTLTAIPAIAAYSAPLAIGFVAAADNTGAVTVAVNGLGAVPLTAPDGSALAAGAVKAGSLITVYYDGTGFRLGAPPHGAVLNAAQAFTKAQRGVVATLADAATITPDFAAANDFTVTLGGNRTLANPLNVATGQSGVIHVVQDGTGNRTLSWGSHWDFQGGTAPILSTAAGAVDVIAYTVRSSSAIVASLAVKGAA